jgi:thioredoxin reductase (NADPH)
MQGKELVDRFKLQAQRFGAQSLEFKEVMHIEQDDGIFKVRTDSEDYIGRAVIIATGSVPKKLNIPGEQEFTGKGVSYCAICDGPLFKGKKIAVIGGGDAAVEEGLYLTRFASKVTLIHRRYQLRAAKLLQERLEKNEKIELMLNYIPISINGDDRITSLTIRNKDTNEEKEINVSGVFMYVGVEPSSQFVKELVKLDEKGYIIADEKMQTSVSGIFAAGDICSGSIQQVACACSDGVVAALSVRSYLSN